MVGTTEGILGLNPETKGLVIDPSIPSEWKEYTMEKTFRGKMPCTVCRITDTGRDAFAEYVAALQTYIKR